MEGAGGGPVLAESPGVVSGSQLPVTPPPGASVRTAHSHANPLPPPKLKFKILFYKKNLLDNRDQHEGVPDRSTEERGGGQVRGAMPPAVKRHWKNRKQNRGNS